MQPRESVHGAYCNIEKGERRGWLSTKMTFLKLRKDTDRKRLFCSNVSTILSMIVGVTLAMKFSLEAVYNKNFSICEKSKYLQIPSNFDVFESFRGYRCQLLSKQLTKHKRVKKHSASCPGNYKPIPSIQIKTSALSLICNQYLFNNNTYNDYLSNWNFLSRMHRFFLLSSLIEFQIKKI